MGIRINENVFSLWINRNLTRVGDRLEDSYRKLSSGEKITRAGDDPAGLSSSQLLRSKITGLQRNQNNCNEGLNLLDISESALSGVTDILQRIRQLAIEASSDTVTDAQRGYLQTEVDELLGEIQRVATTTNYNGRNLLDGSFQGVCLQVGTREGETMPLAIEDIRTNILGSVAVLTAAQAVDATAIAGSGDLVINNVTIPASSYDEISRVDGAASALAKMNAINSMTYQTGVTAKVEPGVYSLSGATIAGGSLDGVSSSLVINGVNIGPVDYVAGDTNGTLCTAINRNQTRTGVTASLGVGGELVLTAADGRNVEVSTTGSVGDELGLLTTNGDLNTVLRGTITLSSPRTILVSGANAQTLLGLAAGQTTAFVDPATAIKSLSIVTFEDAQRAIETIDVAAEQVLKRRSSLGALSSRVEQTLNDLMLNVENLSAADSRIRDADLAVETANMTQAQIIQEAGISILSQANVIPKQALTLLNNR
jgi:flagellin